jgi:glycosyltransferase involved in cell wall biosynthesis
MHVTHVITTLNVGGAELMLLRLVGALRERWDVGADVVCLSGEGDVSARLRDAGFQVTTLGARRRGLPSGRSAFELVGHLRARRPDLIQSWMYHGDLAAVLFSRVAGTPPVVWGLRQSSLGAKDLRPGTLRVARVCARLSNRAPARIVCSSHACERAHAEFGYSPERMVVIPNGFDTEVFRPSAEQRARLRDEWDVPPDSVLIGIAARAHPVKDHPTFLAAMSRVAARHPSARFLLCGDGVSRAAPPFKVILAADPWLAQRCILVGRRDDMPSVMSALDVAVMSSQAGESFPNAVGEAMACGVPCIVTDVGDAAALVGETGAVVQPRRSDSLAEACSALIAAGAEERTRRGAAARQRVIEHYGIARVTDSYHALYLDVLEATRARRPHAHATSAGHRPTHRTVALLARGEPR